MTTALAPLAVGVPLLAAVTIALAAAFLPRRLVDAASILVSASVAGMTAIVFFAALEDPVIHWFGDWEPVGGLAVGISFTVDGMGAGIACLAAVLMAGVFVYSWRYYDEGALHGYHILMLVLLAAMVGFSFTGDLFNLFVFFELMSIAAYALTGYRIEHAAPLAGGLAFAITNTIGSFLLLFGIALIYARTGALNFAQIARTLEEGPTDGLVVVSFTLLVAGLFAKAAVVPWHFWHADTHTVAPSPVCAIFSGVMIQLGLFGVARLYWAVFEPALSSHAPSLGSVFIWFGVITALVGGVMCFAQQHMKRLLAFSSISHVGLFLIGVGTLEHVGLAGAGAYVMGHGLVKASLFLGVGVLLHRYGASDEEFLRGRGRDSYWLGALLAAGGLALAEVPPFAGFIGKTKIEEAAHTLGYDWMPLVFIAAAVLTGGAVLRAVGRVFLGWGPDEPDRFSSERYGEEGEPKETHGGGRRMPVAMGGAATALLLGAVVLGLVPDFSETAERSAAQFQDTDAYTARVLEGTKSTPIRLEHEALPASTFAYSALSAVGAIGLALLALFRRRLPSMLRDRTSSLFGPAIFHLRSLHSGIVGDYVTWLTLGTATLGGLFAVYLR
jgi:multicomponent Na+:H+ antiporter subunit D